MLIKPRYIKLQQHDCFVLKERCKFVPHFFYCDSLVIFDVGYYHRFDVLFALVKTFDAFWLHTTNPELNKIFITFKNF